MRFRLTLSVPGHRRRLPFNYQYPFSAAIYKILESADEDYAAFLHNTGYGESGKNFKLFTFSDIQMRYQVCGDRMEILDREASLTVCFHLPKAASSFVTGIFKSQRLIVADAVSKVCFEVKEIHLLPEPDEGFYAKECLLEPASPVVTGRKNIVGHYQFISPEDPTFEETLIYNLVEKFSALNPTDEAEKEALRASVSIKPVFYRNPPRSRLVTIKTNTQEKTQIKGFTNFRIRAKMPRPLLELALNAGLGLYNAQGMGCVVADRLRT